MEVRAEIYGSSLDTGADAEAKEEYFFLLLLSWLALLAFLQNPGLPGKERAHP